MKIIATSDWHLHSMRPMCRTDEDWVESQAHCLHMLTDYAMEHQYPVLVSGDIFDTPTVTPLVLNMMTSFMVNVYNGTPGIVVSAGNHDLPYHQWDRADECSYYTLEELYSLFYSSAMYIDEELVIEREHFGQDIPKDVTCDILMMHKFAVETDRDRPPMRQSWTADDLLTEYPNARIILVGDNHSPWSKKVGDRLVVNCGTLFRRNLKELTHPTGFWVVDTDTLEAEHVPFFVDYEKERIDTTYSEVEKDRALSAMKYDALIEQLKDGVETDYDFLNTLAEYIRTNGTELGRPVVSFLEDVIDHIKKENE